MGSSGEAGNKGIDSSVGGLVWVRRRNGSWWPGRILGLDEVSESCVVSPRSGTPVKLLGREDASVDWYNLEKSKRVKSFRCGEYEDCIAKAKASAANSSRKAVKYARREDAIIHALEIENSRLGNGHTDAVGDSSVHENGTSAREPASNDDEDDVSDLEKNSDSAQELSQSGLSFEEPNHLSSSKVQSMQGRRRTPNDSEDDGNEGVKRMRGLEDLGVGVGATNRKGQTGGLLELVQQDNASIANSNNENSLSNGNTVNGRTQVGSSLKRKRTQVASANEFLKKKNRRRPLTKVLESTPMVDVRVSCDLPRKVSELEATELKKSGSERNGVSRENGSFVNALKPTRDIDPNKQSEVPSTSGSAENGSSHRLFDVPFVEERRQSAGLPSEAVRFPFDKPLVCGLKSQSSLREGALIGSTSSGALHANIGERLEKGTSKWQLKGKRNSRKLDRNRKPSRKYADSDENSKGCMAGLENGFGKKIGCNGITVSSDSLDCRALRLVDLEYGSKSLTSPDGSLPPQRQLPYRQSRFTVHSRYRMSDLSTKNSPSDSSLYEIKIEVKTSDRPPHVPLVSLMSKLTGKAVVGHPIAVEVLEDELFDGLLGSAVGGDLEDDNSRPDHAGGSVKGRTTTKQSVSRPQQHSPRRNLSPKGKKSGLLPKKIRKLSSLTGGKKSEERKTTTAAAAAVGERRKGPVIACIPLKLVFSRMSEAVNGTGRQTNRAC